MNEKRRKAAGVCDRVVAWSAALVPVGVVLGNVGYEGTVALAVTAFLVRCAIVRKNPLSPVASEPALFAWGLWVAAVIAAVLVKGPGSKGMGHDLALVRYLLFIAAVVDVNRRKPLFSMMAWGLAGAVVLGVVNTVAAYAFGQDLVGHELSRYTGKQQEANRLASIAPYAAPFFLGWAAVAGGDRRWLRALCLGLAALAVGQLVQTRIRTALAGAVAGMAMAAGWLFFRDPRKRTLLVVGSAAVILILAIGGALWAEEGMTELSAMKNRIYIWKVSSLVYRDNPVFGSGVSAFRDAYEKAVDTGKVDPSRATWGKQKFHAYHAHNLALQLLASTGLFGFLTFGAFFVLASRRALANARGRGTGLAAWPVVVLVLGLTGFNVYSSCYQSVLAFFTAMVLLGPGTAGVSREKETA
ncbi:MAG: O-antigen ligase family protein [Deltaproteobacteria bacterium]|nr:O-antigen ligase family protein [Deltaproteobacteria bacterium]